MGRPASRPNRNVGGTAGIALLAILLLAAMPAAAQIAGPAAPAAVPVAVGEVTGDIPADVVARLSASLVSVAGETGRSPSPGEPAELVLRLEAREDPRGIALVLTLVRPGEKPVARLEAVTTRASADARVRALARQLLAPPPEAVKVPRESPPSVPPPPREPTPLEKCESTNGAIFAGGLVSSLGMAWLAYEVIAFHKDLKGVPGGTLFSTVSIGAGSVISSYALRRRARCFELHGCEPQRHLEIAPWAFTVGTLVGLFTGVVIGISNLSHTSEFSDSDDDSERSFAEEFAPYKEKIQYVYLASAGLELINLVVLRPLVWRAAIDRSAAGAAAGATFAPSVFVAGDRRGAPAPLLGVIGTF